MFDTSLPGPMYEDFTVGAVLPPLARLTFNQASLARVLPGPALVVAWDGCDHLGPASEGDLSSSAT